jgi:hypothetical protein
MREFWTNLLGYLNNAMAASVLGAFVGALVGGWLGLITQWKAMRFQLKLQLLRRHIDALCVRIDGYSAALRTYRKNRDNSEAEVHRELEISPDQIRQHLAVVIHLHQRWEKDAPLSEILSELGEGFKYRYPQSDPWDTVDSQVTKRLSVLSELKVRVLKLEAELTAGAKRLAVRASHADTDIDKV